MHFQDLSKGNPRFRPCLPPKAKAERNPKRWTPPPHDYTDRTTAEAQGRLADNKWIGSSGRIYERMQDGSLRRVSPARPWRGKRERREVVQQRGIDRMFEEAFQANAKP